MKHKSDDEEELSDELLFINSSSSRAFVHKGLVDFEQEDEKENMKNSFTSFSSERLDRFRLSSSTPEGSPRTKQKNRIAPYSPASFFSNSPCSSPTSPPSVLSPRTIRGMTNLKLSDGVHANTPSPSIISLESSHPCPSPKYTNQYLGVKCTSLPATGFPSLENTSGAFKCTSITNKNFKLARSCSTLQLDFSPLDSHELPFFPELPDCPPLEPEPPLPLVNPSSEFKCLASETISKLLRKEFRGINFLVIDCRFTYEYDGGHIKDAINLATPEALDAYFFDFSEENVRQGVKEKKAIIFHCEFSSHRAPNLMRHLRKKDRELNADRYPSLYYPHLYLLEGGYCVFFRLYKSLCLPEQYVEMKDIRYQKQMRECFSSLSKNKSRLSKSLSWSL